MLRDMLLWFAHMLNILRTSYLPASCRACEIKIHYKWYSNRDERGPQAVFIFTSLSMRLGGRTNRIAVGRLLA